MGSAVGVTRVVKDVVDYWLIDPESINLVVQRSPARSPGVVATIHNDHLYYHNDIHNDMQFLNFRNPDQQLSYHYIGYGVGQIRFRRHRAVYHFKYYNVNDYISFQLFWLVRPCNLCSMHITNTLCI